MAGVAAELDRGDTLAALLVLVSIWERSNLLDRLPVRFASNNARGLRIGGSGAGRSMSAACPPTLFNLPMTWVPAAGTASAGAAATATALPANGPSPIRLANAEPLPAPVRLEERAVPGTAAAASAARSATKPQRPPSGASPATVAALLARGDTLIATGRGAVARSGNRRAVALASARAAAATGKTCEPHFLPTIGVAADPGATAARFRKGAARGDEDATPLLGGLDVRASQ